MALSVRLDPVLETRIEQEARRLGITKSEFVKDALERALGSKNPYDLLLKVRDPAAFSVREPETRLSENTGERLKALLREKHSD